MNKEIKKIKGKYNSKKLCKKKNRKKNKINKSVKLLRRMKTKVRSINLILIMIFQKIRLKNRTICLDNLKNPLISNKSKIQIQTLTFLNKLMVEKHLK